MKRFVLLLALSAAAAISFGQAVSYTIAGEASGSIGSTNITGDLTLTATGNLSDVHAISAGVFGDNDLTVHYDWDGNVGTLDGLQRFFVNNPAKVAGFSRNGDFGIDIADEFSSMLGSYNYTYTLTDTSGSPIYSDFGGLTSGGQGFNVGSYDETYLQINPNAGSTPAPAALPVVGSFAASFLLRRRKK